MRLIRAAVIASAGLTISCGSPAPMPSIPTTVASTDASAPDPVPTAVGPGPCSIGFEGLSVHGAAFTTYAACGLSIRASGAAWQVSTTYGRPAPFVQFLTPGGTTAVGDVLLQSPGGTFAFASVDIYSSTTKIPYEITGTAHGAEVFSLRDVQGNTFGAFATIVNSHAGAIDALRISLTNPAAPCCTNPVGLDNIRVTW